MANNKEFNINLLRAKKLNLLTKKQIIEILNKATDYQEDYAKEIEAKGEKVDFGTWCYKFMCVVEGEAIEHGVRIEEEREERKNGLK